VLNSLTLIIPGLLLRFWTTGYIGKISRAPSISADYLVVKGPYRFFRHPLYLGNFALVAGVLVALKPSLIMAFAVLLGYLIMYRLIARAETEYLEQSNPEPKETGFNIIEALSEWRTWLVTGTALGLGLLKAFWLVKR